MGFRFYKREKLFGGLGLNLSKSGVSWSIRDKAGSFGPKRTSLRTGIPGLTYVFDKGSSGSNNENGFSITGFIFSAFIYGVLTLIISSIVFVFFPTYFHVLKIVLYVFWGLFCLKAVIGILTIFIPAFTLIYKVIRYIFSLFRKKESISKVENSTEIVPDENEISTVNLKWDEGHGKFMENNGNDSNPILVENRNSGEQPVSSVEMKWDFENEKYVPISVDQQAASSGNEKLNSTNKKIDSDSESFIKKQKSKNIHNSENSHDRLIAQDVEGALFDICSRVELSIENTIIEYQSDKLSAEQIRVAVRYDLSKILSLLEIDPNQTSPERNIIIACYAFFSQPLIDFNAVIEQGENLDYIIADIKQLMNTAHPLKAGDVFFGKDIFKMELGKYQSCLKEIATLVCIIDMHLSKKEKMLLKLIDQ